MKAIIDTALTLVTWHCMLSSDPESHPTEQPGDVTNLNFQGVPPVNSQFHSMSRKLICSCKLELHPQKPSCYI